jgi:cephalosporin hydroxylase
MSIFTQTVTVDRITEWVRRTQACHRGLLNAFHAVMYHAPHTWPVNTWAGRAVLKLPTDLWMYQELITRVQPHLVIETGTAKGGSALWYAHVLDVLSAPADCRVVTVDLDACEVPHPRVVSIVGSSTAPEVVARVRAMARACGGPVLISLDSDHSEAHVAAEIAAYADLVTVGSWLVVEDTNVGGRPVWVSIEDGGPGAAVQAFLTTRDDFVVDVYCERHGHTNNPGGWLRRIR